MRLWTQREEQILMAHYKRAKTTTIAKILRRTPHAVKNRAGDLQLSQNRKTRIHHAIEAKHPLGWTDAEIARKLGVDRHQVGHARRRLGLPANNLSEHRREQIRQRTQQQLEAAGLSNLAELRSKVFRDRARAAGWPSDLRPRAIQILNTLWEKGPRTRRQLADDIGMPWKGSRKSLVSNDPEGSYLAHLVARGLVIRIVRGYQVVGKGSGRSCDLYSLPLYLQRGTVSQTEDSHVENENQRTSASERTHGSRSKA